MRLETRFALAFALTALPLAAGAAVVRQTVTFNRGLIWSDFTYHYEIVNPPGCPPVLAFEVTFVTPLSYVDTDSIQSPNGWGATVNTTTNSIKWSTTLAAARVPAGGTLGGFSITTKCNPNCVDGRQGIVVWDDTGTQRPTQTQNRLQSRLYGSGQIPVPGSARIGFTNADAPRAMAFVFWSPRTASIQTPIGLLELDPSLLALLAQFPLDAAGLGGITLPVPNLPSLRGRSIHLQGLEAVTATGLSNPWRFDFQ